MGSIASPKSSLPYWNLSAAAQGIVAAEFALHGFDVLDQAGRARYWHDLSVASTGGMMKIVVRGSLDGLWELVDPFLVETRKSQKSDYHRAIDLWLERFRHTTCCLVQFDPSNLIGMPRIYLASAAEVAEMLHENVETSGEIALRAGAGSSGEATGEESLPRKWRFSQERIKELMSAGEGKRSLNLRTSRADGGRECVESYPAQSATCLPMMN
jgi:hypothetical protein